MRPIVAAQPTADEPPAALVCERGPLERYFERVQWLVFVTGPKSPADLSFTFIVFMKDGEYRVRGEGNGDRALTRPAHDAITAMNAADYAALHAEASAMAARD